MHRLLFLAVVFIASAAPTAAQMNHSMSPYADLQGREIKALSPEEIEGLLAGDGIEFALPAELNGVPGPKHVLELADSLDLTAEQLLSVRRSEDEMRDRAVELGARLVQAERALDRLFTSGSTEPEAVRAAVGEASSIRSELRSTHLVAHLSTARILTPEQIHSYRRLRGYHVHE